MLLPLSGNNGRADIALAISDPSMVGEARRKAQALARLHSLDETQEGRVGIIVTELATNLCRHARQGVIFLRGSPTEAGLEILAVDSGPGMDVQRCLADGFSSRSTMGGGLGAIQRLSDRFDIYSQLDRGTVVLAHVLTKSSGAQAFGDLGVVRMPYPGETVSGDDWSSSWSSSAASFLVVDGLGHGFAAGEAAEAAVEVFDRVEHTPSETNLQEILNRLHARLRATRGAAASVATVDKAAGVLHFGGIGNVRGCVVRGGEAKSLITLNGTLGLQIRSVRIFTQDFGPDDLLVMHSDGLSAKWDLAAYPGLVLRTAGVIAAVLHRDWRRSNDDSTILVFRLNSRWFKT